MSDWVVDSSVIAKWFLPESDSNLAQQVLEDVPNGGGNLLILDLALIEVANAIRTRVHRGLTTSGQGRLLIDALVSCPVTIEASLSLIETAFDIAVKYQCAVYDALFVALVEQKSGASGITADLPLLKAVQPDFPQIIGLNEWIP